MHSDQPFQLQLDITESSDERVLLSGEAIASKLCALRRPVGGVKDAQERREWYRDPLPEVSCGVPPSHVPRRPFAPSYRGTVRYEAWFLYVVELCDFVRGRKVFVNQSEPHLILY